MDYAAMRSVADSLISGFSNGQAAVLLKGEKSKDTATGKITRTYREITGGLAVMTRYEEEAIAKSGGVIEAGDVKFVCRFSEKPVEIEDRISYAGETYNIVHCSPVNPAGNYVVVYIIQGRKL